MALAPQWVRRRAPSIHGLAGVPRVVHRQAGLTQDATDGDFARRIWGARGGPGRPGAPQGSTIFDTAVSFCTRFEAGLTESELAARAGWRQFLTGYRHILERTENRANDRLGFRSWRLSPAVSSAGIDGRTTAQPKKPFTAVL